MTGGAKPSCAAVKALSRTSTIQGVPGGGQLLNRLPLHSRRSCRVDQRPNHTDKIDPQRLGGGRRTRATGTSPPMTTADNWGWKARIGMFIVSSEPVPEAEWWAMMPAGVSVHAARVTAPTPWARWTGSRETVELEADVERGARQFAAMRLSAVGHRPQLEQHRGRPGMGRCRRQAAVRDCGPWHGRDHERPRLPGRTAGLEGRAAVSGFPSMVRRPDSAEGGLLLCRARFSPRWLHAPRPRAQMA